MANVRSRSVYCVPRDKRIVGYLASPETMDPIQNIKLRWLHGTLGDVTYQLTRVQFARSVPARWQPAINAFRCETAVRICVDFAGVEKVGD